MKLLLAFALALCACSTPSSPPDQQHHPIVGDPCDPNQWQTSCGPGLVCDSTGVCGVPCGNGNTVCDPGTACTAQGDCVPPCLVSGQPWVPPGVSNCSLAGVLEGQDGGCIVPCWWFLCSVVGGTCGG